MRRIGIAAALALGACRGREGAAPASGPAPAPASSPPVAAAPPPADALDPWSVTPAETKPRPPSPCDKLDVPALAVAIEASVLFDIGQGGVLGHDSKMWVCEYFELPKLEHGVQLMISFDTDAKISTEWLPTPQETLDNKVAWRTYRGYGTKPAAIGSAKYFSALQLVTNGVVIETHVGAKAMPARERERRAIAAMTALLPQLPADVAPLIPNRSPTP